MIILIPAYEPDLRLFRLVQSLRAADATATILIVDDGSGPAFQGVFAVAEEAGATVLGFAANRGKGAALRFGFAWARHHRPGESVVCADCDGQHTPEDILRVGAAVRPGTIVLGGRRFTGAVPLRSRVGNTISRWLFRAVTSTAVHDTQTGLRGIPADLLDWLASVPGERFEYEFTVLLRAKDAGVRLHEVEIATVYLAENASSHFRPVRDSLRIYAPLLGFAASSLTSYVIDLVLVVGLQAVTGNLLASVVAARLVSAAYNFQVNRRAVFDYRGDSRRAGLRYGVLAAGLLAINYVLLAGLVGLGWGVAPAKIAVEAVLFVASYVAQYRFVFRDRIAALVPATCSRHADAAPLAPAPLASAQLPRVPRSALGVASAHTVTGR